MISITLFTSAWSNPMNLSDAQSVERRPLATRNKRWAKRLATALAECGATPNAISVVGMICAMFAAVLFAATAWTTPSGWTRLLWLGGAVGVQLRLIANMLDGMVAIASGRACPVGELYNEAPDRLSDAAILIGLGYAADAEPALGYLAACLAIFTAYIRALARGGAGPGATQDFCGPMAKPQRMCAVTLTAVYLILAPDAWRSLDAIGVEYSMVNAALLVIIAGTALTAVRRLIRAAGRLRESSP